MIVFILLSFPYSVDRDGYGATNEIRKLEKLQNIEPPVIIIAVTAHATNSDKQQCFEAGMNDCIFICFCYSLLLLLLYDLIRYKQTTKERAHHERIQQMD